MKYLLPKTALVVHNALTDAVPYPDAPITDNDTVSTAGEISEILKDAGVKAQLFPVENLSDLKLLEKTKTGFIFNCADDNIGDIPFSSHLVPEIAGKKGVPFSGGTAENILLTTDKAATKKVLLKNNIPTAPFIVVESQIRPGPLNFPLIVKPVASDGSEGVTQKSVVENQKQLIKAIENNFRLFRQPALVEKYIEGREINVAILEVKGSAKILPASEITFPKEFGQKYKIVDFESKWRPETPQYNHTPAICPANIPQKLNRQLINLAGKVWKILDLKSYARVDFRIDKYGHPFILEVNVNPDIENSPEIGFPRAAGASGLNYKNLILTIVDSAMHRGKITSS